MKKYLAIDYGTKRIGLAINIASLAEPLLVLDNQLDFDHPIVSSQVLNEVSSICEENKIEEIIVGMSEAKMAEQTKEFAKIIQKKIKLPITLIDETLSSYEVGRRMKEASFKLKKRQGQIDHYAAALILEDFLETN